MVVRILIAGFASFVSALGYLTGLTRLMTGLILGFGAFCSLLLGLLFVLPLDPERLVMPLYEAVSPWPYFLLGLLLLGMTLVLYLYKSGKTPSEPVSSSHFKYLLGGIGGYLVSMYFSSLFWFPSDARRMSAETSSLTLEVLLGTCLYLAGVSVSCYLFYRASKGNSEQNPDLMRRFVLALFAFFQLDKMPLLVAYMLLYSPETEVIFPNIAALALCSYIPVGIFLLKTTWDSRDD